VAQSFEHITLVSVNGLPDASGAARALAHSLMQMPGARAVFCSPHRPDALPDGARHVAIAPMNYHEYSWFMMFALWRVVDTEFALVVQEDGWVVNAANWRDAFLDYDYIGAPIHLALITTPHGTHWKKSFEWTHEPTQPGHSVTPVQNGGFSLRSQRFMRALVDYRHIRVEIPPPDAVDGDPLRMRWDNNALLEDVQLSGVLRPALQAVGMRFAPIDIARAFSIEHAGPSIHHGYDAMQLFGHHAKVRRLTSLSPLTVGCGIPLSQLDGWYGERDILSMFERNGYRIEFAAEPLCAHVASAEPLRMRKVFDCFTYNGEDDILAARLHELSGVVDFFVIVEADCTFSGEPKALTFDADDVRFAPFAARLRYVVVHDMPGDDAGSAVAPVLPAQKDWLRAKPQTGHWVREKFQRNQVMRGLADSHPNDLVMVSDVDEIPRADVVRLMRDDQAHDVFGLSLAFYYFYANYRNVEGPEVASIWTVAATRARLETTTPDRLRMEVRNGVQPAILIGDAGWHLSYMGMSDDDVRRKISTFAHQEYNTPEILAAIDIGALTASGLDLYGRPGYVWKVVSPAEAPGWMAAQAGLRHLFLDDEQAASKEGRYRKESYVAVEPSPFGFWEGHANRHILDAYRGYIRGRVLDIGCNHGASTFWLQENPEVDHITGIDLNEEALVLARSLFASVPVPSSFLRADITQQALEGGSADTIVSFHTLEHIYATDAPAFMKSAFDALASNGYLVISIPYDRAYMDPCHVCFYTEKSLSRLMERAGFTTIECFKDDRFAEKDLLTGLFQKMDVRS
jgi:SAM-dependent methyltransferase